MPQPHAYRYFKVAPDVSSLLRHFSLALSLGGNINIASPRMVVMYIIFYISSIPPVLASASDTRVDVANDRYAAIREGSVCRYVFTVARHARLPTMSPHHDDDADALCFAAEDAA